MTDNTTVETRRQRSALALADAVAEAREVLREMHGATKDLRQAIAETRQLARSLAEDAAQEIAACIAAAGPATQETPARARGVPGVVRCPACGAIATPGPGSTLEHASGCSLSDAFEAVTGPEGSDARWFREHPDAEEFVRDITPAELADLRTVGLPAEDWASEHSSPLPDWIAIAYKKVRVTRVNDDDGQMWARCRKFLP